MPDVRRRAIALIGILFIVVIVIITVMDTTNSETKLSEEETAVMNEAISQGKDYITGLESRDPAEIESTLKAQRLEKLNAQREERLAELESGEISVWSLFEDYVILGDSRAVGFTVYDYLPESRVLAAAGNTIMNVEEHLGDLEELNPSYIFLCYGLNDMGFYATADDYYESYKEVLESIRETVPDAKIFVSSILPVCDPAFAQSSKWYELDDYSAAAEKATEAYDNCYYFDNTEISEERMAEDWQPDGIHVGAYFYPYWATNMIMAVYDSELYADEDLSDAAEAKDQTSAAEEQ